jgi:hypothetical protein
MPSGSVVACRSGPSRSSCVEACEPSAAVTVVVERAPVRGGLPPPPGLVRLKKHGVRGGRLRLDHGGELQVVEHARLDHHRR